MRLMAEMAGLWLWLVVAWVVLAWIIGPYLGRILRRLED